MFAIVSICSVGLLAGCGGSSSSSTTTTSSSIPSPKDAVRTQTDAIITTYLENMVRQMPSVTSKVAQNDVASCMKTQVGQMIDSIQPQQGQPNADFANMLMNQVQSSLYGIVGMCARVTG